MTEEDMFAILERDYPGRSFEILDIEDGAYNFAFGITLTTTRYRKMTFYLTSSLPEITLAKYDNTCIFTHLS